MVQGRLIFLVISHRICLVIEASSCMFTVDRKSYSRFTAQLYLFHKCKAKGEEIRTIEDGSFANGCAK
jgi:hypothetical protein